MFNSSIDLWFDCKVSARLGATFGRARCCPLAWRTDSPRWSALVLCQSGGWESEAGFGGSGVWRGWNDGVRKGTPSYAGLEFWWWVWRRPEWLGAEEHTILCGLSLTLSNFSFRGAEKFWISVITNRRIVGVQRYDHFSFQFQNIGTGSGFGFP